MQQDLSIEAGQYAGSVGTLAYLRGMLLFLGIVAARASLKGEVIEKLGGKNGVVGVSMRWVFTHLISLNL